MISIPKKLGSEVLTGENCFSYTEWLEWHE